MSLYSSPATGNLSSSGVARNALVKIAAIGFTSVIEIFYARFLVKNLGVDLYGILPLATNVIMFGSIINLTVISSLGRFMAIEIHRGDKGSAREYYSTGNLLIWFVCAVLLVISVAISWWAPVMFKVPPGYENETRILFAAVFLSFIVSFAVSGITVGTFVYNRLDLNDWLNFGKVVCSRGLAVMLIFWLGYKLNGISMGLLVATIATLTGGMFIHKKLTPEFHIFFNSFKKKLAHKMLSFSGWLMLRQISVRMLIFADLFIVNHRYGATQSGLYAIAFFFPSKLRILTGPFAGLLKPVILNRYARKDFAGMVEITCQGMRLSGVVFAFPVGVLCGLYRPVLSLWVGPQYQSLYWIAVILTCHVGLNVSCYPLFAIQDAFNRVKIPSLFSTVMAGVYFLLAFTLSSSCVGLGLAGVALAGALSLTFNHSVFNPLYTALLLKISPKKFYKAFLPGIAGFMLTAFTLHYVLRWQTPSSFFSLLLLCCIAGIIYGIISWYILLSDLERQFIRKTVSGLQRRIV